MIAGTRLMGNKPWECPLLLVLTFMAVSTGHTKDLYWDSAVPVMIRKPSTSVNYQYSWRRSDTESQGIGNSGQSTGSSVGLSFSTGGFVYHPALLEFDASVGPSFGKQNFENSMNENSEFQSNFVTYRLSTTWLKLKPYRLTLDAARERSQISHSFQPDTFSEVENRSGQIVIGVAGQPFDITFGEADSETLGYFERELKTSFWSLRSKRVGEKSRLDFDVRNQSRLTSSNKNLGFSSESTTGRLSHRLEIGADILLNSNANLRRFEIADRTTDRTATNSRLHIRLPYNFTYDIAAGTSLVSATGQESASERTKSFSLSHKLYENLSTSVGYSTRQYGEGGETISSRAQTRYQRRIPWGRISMGASKNRVAKTLLPYSTTRQIIDEAYQFQISTSSIVLQDRYIDPASIILTDASGLTVYEEGFDYVIEQIDGAYLIIRNELGTIGDSETVLVSYLTTPETASEIIADGNSVDFNLSLGNSIGLFYSKNEQLATRRFALGGNLLENSKQTNYGTSIATKLGRTLIRVQTHLSPQIDYRTHSLEHRTKFSITDRIILNASAAIADFDLLSTGEKRRTISGSATTSFRVRKTGRLQLRATVRKTDTNSSNENAGIGQENLALSATYEWRYGAWHMRLIATANESTNFFLENYPSNSVRGIGVNFGMRREFR